MIKIFHSLNTIPTKGEINTKPSLTEPDQGLTVQEIIQRDQNGTLNLSVLNRKKPIFNGEILVKDPRSLDLIDRQEFALQTIEKIDKVKTAQKNQKDFLDRQKQSHKPDEIA